MLALIDQLVINLVLNQPEIVLMAQRRYRGEFLPRVDRPSDYSALPERSREFAGRRRPPSR